MTKDVVQDYNVLYKSINILFFNTFFDNTIYLSKYILFCNQKVEIMDLVAKNLLYLRYVFVVPLVFYSRIIGFSFNFRWK